MFHTFILLLNVFCSHVSEMFYSLLFIFLMIVYVYEMLLFFFSCSSSYVY